jgi:hypothetical protein
MLPTLFEQLKKTSSLRNTALGKNTILLAKPTIENKKRKKPTVNWF